MFPKFVTACTLFVCLSGSAFAQSSADTTIVPLIVDKGVPLQMLLTEKVPYKEGAPVHAKLTEPVYAFDREVIPSGTEVEGTITGFRKGGTWSRVSALLSGDFTPVREPEIEFRTLVLADGTRIPVETSVGAGTEKVAGSAGKQLTSTIKKPGKEQLKNWLWGMSPYHPQYLPAGMHLNAVLNTPLDFGTAVLRNGELEEMGSQPPVNSITSVRMLTALNSKTAKPGMPIEAITTQPLFSPSHRLIFPVGSKLRGQVTEVTQARKLHHNGQLAFNFTSVVPPDSLTSGAVQVRQVDGSLVSLQVTHDMRHLRIGADGSTRIAESKKRFIAPAWSFIKAERSINHSANSFETALLGAYRGKFLKQVTGSDPGFGLPAGISGAMMPPVGMAFGFYGAARSVYTNFLKRGKDIDIPENTPMEIRLEKATEQ
jgi:hypothetical protein